MKDELGATLSISSFMESVQYVFMIAALSTFHFMQETSLLP